MKRYPEVIKLSYTFYTLKPACLLVDLTKRLSSKKEAEHNVPLFY